MSAPVFVALALVAGALLAAQGPILARLAVYAGGPIQAAIVAFAIGLTALVALCLLTGGALPRPSGVLRMPIWVWAGGLIGTSLLVLTLLAVPRIGVTTFAAAVVCGQLVAALAYDHTGAFGLELRRIELRDLAGVALLIAGLVMITGHQRN
ncbi:MAG: DMT family transporter [Thalassobaculum sp.]|uniref:DMT family transporter n=1 Tax=Thalassobaculum sp. TaxID=2022740 RepID=UPI0032EF91FE